MAQSEETKRARVRAHDNRRHVIASALGWFDEKAIDGEIRHHHARQWWRGCADHELALAHACAAFVLHPERPPLNPTSESET